MADLIVKETPTHIDKTFDVWHIMGISIVPKIDGPYILSCEFAPVHNTGETMQITSVDENNEEIQIPLLDVEGNSRIKWEAHPHERARLDIPDLLEWIRNKAMEEDLRAVQALNLLMTLLTEAAMEKNIIDVATE